MYTHTHKCIYVYITYANIYINRHAMDDRQPAWQPAWQPPWQPARHMDWQPPEAYNLVEYDTI